MHLFIDLVNTSSSSKTHVVLIQSKLRQTLVSSLLPVFCLFLHPISLFSFLPHSPSLCLSAVSLLLVKVILADAGRPQETKSHWKKRQNNFLPLGTDWTVLRSNRFGDTVTKISLLTMLFSLSSSLLPSPCASWSERTNPYSHIYWLPFLFFSLYFLGIVALCLSSSVSVCLSSSQPVSPVNS